MQCLEDGLNHMDRPHLLPHLMGWIEPMVEKAYEVFAYESNKNGVVVVPQGGLSKMLEVAVQRLSPWVLDSIDRDVQALCGERVREVDHLGA